MALTVENLSIGYGRTTVARGIGFHLKPGRVLAVLGANGCGKTTLFRTLLGVIAPLGGRVAVDGTELTALSRRDLGRRLAYVPQCHNCVYSYPAIDVAVMGRHPFLGTFAEPGPRDYALAGEALNCLGVGHLAGRSYQRLSGGEKQLILLARALIQQPGYLIMDEPTANLDPKNTAMVLERILSLRARDMGLLITTHSLREARVYADRVLMMKDGGVHALGGRELLDDDKVVGSLYDLECGSELPPPVLRYIRERA